MNDCIWADDQNLGKELPHSHYGLEMLEMQICMDNEVVTGQKPRWF